MGCDIHLYVEVFDKKANRWYDAEDNEYYDGRNYTLFSVLADVRNRYGFAGCDMGNKVQPIDYPRGLPTDVSEFIQEESDGWGIDGHSHSYLTLKELKKYNWNSGCINRGWVGTDGFLEYKKNGFPTNYSGGISGRNVQHIDNAEMEKRIANNNSKDCYTQLEWTSSLYDECSDFVDDTIPKLEALVPDDNDDHVRIVFWFDN